MYPGVARRAHVYAPLGRDVADHLLRIAGFNQRAVNPTSWELDVHCSEDFLERMVAERRGDVMVLSGRNRRKIDLIQASLEAGLHVLADKPWTIEARDLGKLESALDTAKRKGLAAYDIMTERFEITSILQRELVNDADVFGEIARGDASRPSVWMESVHHLKKTVAGAALRRPPWFFDIRVQGEALADVGTHLVDLVQWTLFPEQPLDGKQDVRIISARRWPTVLSRAELLSITGEETAAADSFEYYCNNAVSYTLRGVHVKLDVLWNFEAPQGAGDTHLAVYRGTRSSIEVRQGREENCPPELYVVPAGAAKKSELLGALGERLRRLEAHYAGLGVEDQGERLRVTIPEAHRIGHEAHFGEVTRLFFRYVLGEERLPDWERGYMLAKYGVTTKGVLAARTV